MRRRGVLMRPVDWALRAAFNISLDQLDELIENVFSGQQTESGVPADPGKALSYGLVYSISRNLATDLAKLPLLLFREEPDGSKHPAAEHPVYRLLKVAPNRLMTPLVYRQLIWFQVFWWGNHYSLKIRDKRGIVRELWPLNPALMEVAVDPEQRTVGYIYREGGTDKLLDPDDVFHIHALGSNGLAGRSPLRQVSESLGSYMAVERYAAKWFANGGKPSVLLEYPAGFTTKEAEQEFYRKWRDAHSGPSAHNVGVLQKGLKYVAEFSTSPEAAQMLQTRLWHKQDLAQVLRMPLHMLNELSRSTFSNIYEQDLQYIKFGLLDWLILLEQEISRQLLEPAEQLSYAAKHNVDALLRGDIEKRNRAYATGRQWGWMTVNDILRKEDMNPIPGGDTYLRPSNMVEIDAQGMPTTGQLMTPAAGAATGAAPEKPEDERLAFIELLERVQALEVHANAA